MPNVDDHGLEVLKKAARNIDPTPKKDYALQVVEVKNDIVGSGAYTPVIQNVAIPLKDVEIEIILPVSQKSFILKARKVSRLRLAFIVGGTSVEWVTIPRGGYWIEEKKLQDNKLYIQSSIDDNEIEVVTYT
jgi:hypothetical protein